MNTYVTNRLSDSRVISGLFKEAQFSQRLIEIEIDEFTRFAEVYEVIEDSARSKTAVREISFKATEELKFGGSLNCCIRFPRFIANFSLGIKNHNASAGIFTADLPEQVELSDRRSKQEPRYAINMKSAIPVIVENCGLHTEGHLLVTDVSVGGYGGILRLPDSFSVNDGSNLFGEVSLDDSVLKLDTQIVRVCLMERKDQFTEYGVGLRRELQGNSNEVAFGSERRTEFRVDVNRELSIGHPLVEKRSVKGLILESSVIGFSWKPLDLDQFKSATPGMIMNTIDPSLQVELIGYAGENLRFNVVSGEENERIKWLKLLSPRFVENLGTSVDFASDLIELFCTSGSLASGYVKAQKGIGKILADEIAKEDPQDGLMHRWIQYSADGQIRGHVSSCRFSDNIWYMGDLAGSLYEERSISPELGPRFLYSLGRSLRSCEPTPAIMKLFFDGHPYWKLFCETMSTIPHIDKVISWTKLYYERISEGHRTGMLEPLLKVTEIRSSDTKNINGILSALRDNERRLAESLDFNTFTFGSPRLKSLMGSKSNFKRKYLHIYGKNEGLLILNQLNAGSSISRTTDVAWYFPIDSLQLKKGDIESIISLAHFHGLKRGISVTGILIPKEDLSNENQESKSVICSLVQPDAYDFYKTIAWPLKKS